jgi:UDP-glucose 4-epimerase
VSPRAAFFEIDLRDGPAVARALAAFRPEIVNHHAAQIDVRHSVTDPVQDAMVNIVGALHMLQAAVAAGVRKIVYASTGGALYGEGRRLPADESHPVNPEAPYGASKHTLEHYLYIYRLLHDLDYTVLRYPNVFGPRQNPHGEAGVNAIFIGLMSDGRQPTIFGDGEQVRDYLYVGDVVAANVLALDRGSGEIVNLGWGKGVSVNDIFRSLKRILAFPGEPLHVEKRAGEVQRIYLDATRAREVLGWTPRIDFDEGLRRTVRWYQEEQAKAGAP